MKHDSDILKRIKSYFMRRKSAKEAHAFERDAERDAFLYEAMEGFEGMLTSDIQQAMDELDDRLDEKSKRFILPVYFKQAASVAALIVVGGALWFTVFRSSDQEPEVATGNQSEEHYTPRQENAKFDSMGQIAMDSDTLSQDSILESAYATADQEPMQMMQPPPPPEESLSSALNDLSDSPLEETTEQANDIVQAEIAIDEDETVVEEIEEVSGFAVMEPEMADSEVPTSRKAAPMSTMDSKAKSEDKANNNPTPVDGWSAYNAYLKTNLNASESMPSGKVTLSFELDRNGKPKKIAVVKSLCTACDAEAIRLVSNGPAWKSEDKKAQGSVSVSFP